MQTTELFKRGKWAVILITAMLAACGGGDGDETPAPEPESAMVLPTVQGGRASLLAGTLKNECGAVGSVGAINVRQAVVWLADQSCSGGARIQSFDTATGAAKTFLSLPAGQQAYQYPTGLGWDSKDNLYVVDGWNAVAKYPVDFTWPAPRPGQAAGIWKATEGRLEIFAGVMLASIVDGQGQEAGFHVPNGLAFDSEDNLYTQDRGAIRKVTQAANVSSIPFSGSGVPVADSEGQHVYASRTVLGVNELYNLSTDTVSTTLPVKAEIALFDAAGNLYVGQLGNPNQAGAIYRQKVGSQNFEAIVTNVQYLNSAAVDDKGNLYLHQRNAIVKVQLD